MSRVASTAVAAATALLATSAPARTTRADQAYFGWPQYALGFAPPALLPSEAGVFVGPSSPAFVFGWSWQVPFGEQLHHRVVGELDLLVRSSGVSSARGRLGYRAGGRHLFGGAGAGLQPGAVTVSPELGVKFAHLGPDYRDGLDASLHVVARADLAPASGGVSATVLLGWNLF